VETGDKLYFIHVYIKKLVYGYDLGGVVNAIGEVGIIDNTT
jgi:hypothetical protein